MALKDYEAEMARCSQCSYCRYIPLDHMKSIRFSKGCPSTAYNNFMSYSARGRYAVAQSLLRKQSEYTDKVQEIAFKCMACGSCDVTCKVCRYNLEPLEMVLELKSDLVKNKKTLPVLDSIVGNLRKQHNSLGLTNEKRGKWADGIKVKYLPKEKAEILFYAGCQFSFDPSLQKIARTYVTILQKAGVDVGIMGDAEMCCGERVFSMGYKDDFERCAEMNFDVWKKAGVKQIITACADCYHAFKRLYPTIGSQIQVFHTVEFIDHLIKENKIKFSKSIPMTVTYHDPCKLGRQGEPYVPWNGQEKKIKNQIVIYEPKKPRYNGAWGIYDAPRNVLNSIPGVELVEMERIKEYAWCCGSGGGVKEAYPDFSNWTAKERIAEAHTTGAAAIVTACPWCEKNFSDAIKTAGDSMKVMDVVELVEQAI